MTDFSQKRFVDLGQTLYVEWLKIEIESTSEIGRMTEHERRGCFNLCAKVAFEAAEEFAKVFAHQEDKFKK